MNQGSGYGTKDGTATGREFRARPAGGWDHALAKCRLLVAGDILKRDRLKGGRDLPRRLPDDWLFTAEEPKRQAPPDAREIDLKDRTLDLIDSFAATERIILMGMALGVGCRGIAVELKRSRGEGVVKLEFRTVARRMHHLAELFARRLNAAGEPVDEATVERLQKALEREIDRD